MLWLSLFLAVIAQAVPAQPAQPVPARMPKAVVLPNAMAPSFLKYVACLDDKTDMSKLTDAASFKVIVESGITACKPVRAGLVGEAEAALAGDPKYSDPAARTKAATAAFDIQDEIQHAMGEGRVLYEGE